MKAQHLTQLAYSIRLVCGGQAAQVDALIEGLESVAAADESALEL